MNKTPALQTKPKYVDEQVWLTFNHILKEILKVWTANTKQSLIPLVETNLQLWGFGEKKSQNIDLTAGRHQAISSK